MLTYTRSQILPSTFHSCVKRIIYLYCFLRYNKSYHAHYKSIKKIEMFNIIPRIIYLENLYYIYIIRL